MMERGGILCDGTGRVYFVMNGEGIQKKQTEITILYITIARDPS